MNDNIIKMARHMVGCKDITCEACLSRRKKLFGDNKCALIEYAEVLDKEGYRNRSETVEEFAKLKAENESLKKQLEEQRKKVSTMNGLLPKSRCETPIEELALSKRAYNCLKRGGIKTIGQLKKMTEEELIRVRILQTQGNILYRAYQLINDLAEQYSKE